MAMHKEKEAVYSDDNRLPRASIDKVRFALKDTAFNVPCILQLSLVRPTDGWINKQADRI